MSLESWSERAAPKDNGNIAMMSTVFDDELRGDQALRPRRILDSTLFACSMPLPTAPGVVT